MFSLFYKSTVPKVLSLDGKNIRILKGRYEVYINDLVKVYFL